MKIKLVIEKDKKSVSAEIGAETLSQFLSRLPCNKDTREFFEITSEIQSEKIQESIAQMDNMFPDILDSLSLKNSPNVIRNLVRNENYKKRLTIDQVRKVINDNYAIESIISNIEQFEEIDSEILLKELVDNPNPDIRFMIAEGWNVPKKYKKMLLKDQDADVRFAAAKSLNN
jgi:hypothetical protein